MKFLFVHQNFPGQFAHLAPALARAGHQVVALTSRVDKSEDWKGVRVLPYKWSEPEGQVLHPWVKKTNLAAHRGTAVLRAATALRARGFMPDAVVAHPGWGEALFLREVWPEAALANFCEYYYRATGADIGFDPEFTNRNEFGGVHRVRMMNLPLQMQLEAADAGIAPTHWQADAFPPALRDKISVIHDGIDTAAATPDPAARLDLPGIGSWSREDEVITFVNRNLEPYRGFHVFMRALPELLRRRPDAQILICGDEGVSYGVAPRSGGTWKDVLTAEVRDRIPDADWARVHFTGRIPHDAFRRMLQVSRVHLYLTYPFVLSWSLLEAMSTGCAVVGSATQPVKEVIADGETGLLFDFFDGAAMVDAVCRLCDDAPLRARLGRAARDLVVARYDLATICLPAQFRWIETLVADR